MNFDLVALAKLKQTLDGKKSGQKGIRAVVVKFVLGSAGVIRQIFDRGIRPPGAD